MWALLQALDLFVEISLQCLSCIIIIIDHHINDEDEDDYYDDVHDHPDDHHIQDEDEDAYDGACFYLWHQWHSPRWIGSEKIYKAPPGGNTGFSHSKNEKFSKSHF